MPPFVRSTPLLALLALAACRPAVSVKPVPSPNPPTLPVAGPLSTEEPGPTTLQTLRLLDLDGLWTRSPTAAVARLNGRLKDARDEKVLAAQADLLLLLARRFEVSEPRRAPGWYLLAAARAWEYLFESAPPTLERSFDRRFQRMRLVYNLALGEYLRLRHLTHGGLGGHVQGAVYEVVSVRAARGPGLLDPTRLDRVLPSWELKVRGLRNHYRRGGIGAELTVVEENRRQQPVDRFIPLEGRVDPATAVLAFDRADSPRRRTATLSLYDPRDVDAISIGGERVPLAADFTTPFGYLAGTTDLQRVGKQGVVQVEKALERQGLYLIQPYDPHRIPIVMVHGLRSSPLAWAELTNDLMGDPLLRRSYQVWHYMYATSFPFLFSGSVLRETLEALRQTLDPAGVDPAMQSMVIVAHSMGGLVARTLMSNSSSHLWDAAFTVPPGQLRGLVSDIETVRRSFVFEAAPYVHRAIFIAVPHRGSEAADGFLGRLGSSLLALPDDFKDTFRRLTEDNHDAVTEEMRDVMARGGPTSIRAMSPRHPVTLRLADLPIDPRVPFHTILGDRGLAQGGERLGDDGLITYESAHLEGAASEKVFPARHDVYQHPLAIAEVKRILVLHLRDRAAAEAPGPPPGDAPRPIVH